MSKNIFAVVIVGLVIVVGTGGYFIGSSKNAVAEVKADDKKTVQPAEDFMKPHVPMALTDAQKAQLKMGLDAHSPSELTFDVTGGSFYFTPNEIRVKQGDKVKINFTNAGGMHNLILDAFNVQTKTLKTGESEVISFTANKKGTFEFYCGVGNGYHRMMGQIGALIVE